MSSPRRVTTLPKCAAKFLCALDRPQDTRSMRTKITIALMSVSTLIQMHAVHATAAPTGSITVCVGTLTGLVRVVRPADRCLPLERKETFQLQGPQGPQGPAGPPGPP